MTGYSTSLSDDQLATLLDVLDERGQEIVRRYLGRRPLTHDEKLCLWDQLIAELEADSEGELTTRGKAIDEIAGKLQFY